LPVVDDPAISNDEIILRRVPHPAETTRDVKAAIGLRPRSSAFDPNRDGTPMSVQRFAVLEELGQDPAAVMLKDFPSWGIVSFPAGLVREFGKGLAMDANPEDGPGHAVIENLTESERRRVAKACNWVVVPAGYTPA
jgi:hypothetical protein